MKTSTYITVAFALFVFTTTMLLPIDSKLREQEHLIDQKAHVLTMKQYYLNELLIVSKSQFSENVSIIKNMNFSYFSKYTFYSSIEYLYKNAERFKDIETLNLVKDLCEFQLKKKRLSDGQRYTYAKTLFNLGEETAAFKQLKIISEKSDMHKSFRTKNGISKSTIRMSYVDAAIDIIANYKQGSQISDENKAWPSRVFEQFEPWKEEGYTAI